MTITNEEILSEEYIKLAILKIAITTNNINEHGIVLDPHFFGNPRVSPLAYVAVVVSEYSVHGEVPGFELLRARLRHANLSGVAFRASELDDVVCRIEAVQVGAVDSIISGYVKIARNKRVVTAIQHAYSEVIKKASGGEVVSIDDVVSTIEEGASVIEVQPDAIPIEDIPFVDQAVDSTIYIGVHFPGSLVSGIKRGEVFIFLGPPKGRKTSFLIFSTINALLDDKDVRAIYFSYEMSAELIRDRFVTSLRTIAVRRGINNVRFGDVKSLISILGLENRLFLRYLEPNTTVADACRVLDRLQSRGMKPDLVVCDYMAFMMPSTRMVEKRHQLAQVARDMVKMAKKYQCAVLTAQLLKRETITRDTPITRADISESYEVIAIVDAAVAIQTNEKLKQSQIYELRCIAARRFQDDVSLGYYQVADDGITIFEADGHAGGNDANDNGIVFKREDFDNKNYGEDDETRY